MSTAAKANAGASSGEGTADIGLSDVFGALETQSRVIMALVLRETLGRYGQHKLGFLWALIEPMVMVSVFVAIMSSFRADDPGGIPMVLFMITGFVPFTLFRDTMSQMQGAIASNRSLLGFPQVTTFDVIAARAVLEVSVVLIVFVCLLSIAHVVGYRIDVENPLGVLAACLLLAGMGAGLGFLFAAIVPIVPSVRQITTIAFGRPLFLGSGLFYTAESLPPSVREWLLWNPLLHAMELLRTEFFKEFESQHGDWGYASIWSVGTLAFGMLVHQALRRRATVGI